MQSPLRTNGTSNQTQIAQIRSTPDINCQRCQPHGQITVRSKINHDDTQNHSEFRELPYIQLRFPYISVIPVSKLYRRKAVTVTREHCHRSHRSVEVTPSRRRGININCQSPPQAGGCC